MSGSNCCDPRTIHLFLRKPDGTFAARKEVKFVRTDADSTKIHPMGRGRSRPHLFDWNRDGTIDLVLSDQLCWAAGPLVGRTEIKVKPFPLPKLPGTHPLHHEFTDWDGDGTIDLLMSAQHLKTPAGPWIYAVYWYRNGSAKGEPKFELPTRLVTVPEPWEINGIAVSHLGGKSRPDLVVSVTKNWQRTPERGWTVDSQLWQYRR